jgi:hypothetical protein
MKEFGGYRTDGSVRFDGASIEQIRWGGNDDPNLVLKVGEVYKVAGIDVHSYHTKLTLVGIDGRFNAASFTPV